MLDMLFSSDNLAILPFSVDFHKFTSPDLCASSTAGRTSGILNLAIQGRIEYNGSVRKKERKNMQKGLDHLWIVQN